MIIEPTYAIALAAALLWTTAFSMTSRFPVRGLRNLGILALRGQPLSYKLTLPHYGSVTNRRQLKALRKLGLADGLRRSPLAEWRDKGKKVDTPGPNW